MKSCEASRVVSPYSADEDLRKLRSSGLSTDSTLTTPPLSCAVLRKCEGSALRIKNTLVGAERGQVTSSAAGTFYDLSSHLFRVVAAHLC